MLGSNHSMKYGAAIVAAVSLSPSSWRIFDSRGGLRRQGNHLLACMTANSEPSNQSFEVDREATVCFASRRFFLGDGRCGRRFSRGLVPSNRLD